jgi:hypothetical protein
MKAKYLILFTILFYATVFGQTYEWVNLISPDYPYNPSYLHAPSAIDNSGNPVCARLVHFRQTYNFGTLGDVKLEKRSSLDSLIWENTIYGKANVSKIILDPDNNVICIGTYSDTITVETSLLIHSGSGLGNFILKLNNTGNLLWLKDATEYAADIYELSALSNGYSNDFLIGLSRWGFDTKILRLNNDGTLLSTIEQTGVSLISDIDQDSFGNIWVAGFSFQNSASFNGLDTIAPFTYTEYVVKYNSAGIAQWVNFIQDITVQDWQIETDNSGYAYLGGNLLDSTSFGSLFANGPQWVYDFFVTRIDPDGNYIWLNEIPPGNTSGDATTGNTNFLSCSNDGNTYITGFFRGTINFGNGVVLSTVNFHDLFVLSYDQDGEIQWAKAAGSSGYDTGCGIAADNNGNCYVSGVVSQNAVFDTISVTGGSINLFIARLIYDNPVNVNDDLISEVLPAIEYSLGQNYPNPFNPSTVIIFHLPVSNDVTLKVYDVLGNEVATLVNEEKQPGVYEVEFNTSSHSGNIQNLTSGVYFYTLRAGSFVETKKMILLR